MKRDVQEVADQLLGSLDSVDEVAGEGASNDAEFMEQLYEAVSECSECGRWCDSCEVDDEGACESCQSDKDE